MNAWFDRNRWPKMVILVKIVKIGQLQMPVESREPIMLKILLKTYIYHRWTKKNSIWKVFYGVHPHKKFPINHSEMVTKFAVAGWVQTMKFFSSQNHIENFVVIILGRFQTEFYEEPIKLIFCLRGLWKTTLKCLAIKLLHYLPAQFLSSS